MANAQRAGRWLTATLTGPLRSRSRGLTHPCRSAMADRKEASTTPVVPTVAGLAGAGMMAVGFGAGYGARAWNNSEAKRELLEKFPEQPTLEAEALARRGAFRAFAAGTALAGLMGVGAVFVARSYGITSMQQFGAPRQGSNPGRADFARDQRPHATALLSIWSALLLTRSSLALDRR